MSERLRLDEVKRILANRTEFSDALSSLCTLAASLISAPVVMINLLDEESAWAVANHGFKNSQVDRCDSFCEHSMTRNTLTEIKDARTDDRVSSNVFVVNAPYVRFYAGQPLVTKSNLRLGTFAIYDFVSRELSTEATEHLRRLALIASSLLEASGALKLKDESDLILEREREFVNAILENLSEGVVACDRDGRLSLFNRAAKSLHEMDPNADLPSLEWAKRYGMFQSDGTTPLSAGDVPLIRAFNGESVKQYEMTVIAPSGIARKVAGNAEQVINKDGHRIGAVVTMYDVSELKRKEKLLIESNHAAEAATRAKSEFLANMSHEIRTPLNGIMGIAELVSEGELDPYQRENLRLIDSSSKHLLNVVNDILDFSKIEAGKLEIEMSDFNLQDFVNDAFRTMMPMANKKALKLSWPDEIPPNLYVRSDQARLKQVILNLLGNAIKFSEVGGVTCTIDIDDSIPNHVDVRFSIRDTGIGMSETSLSKLFQAFTQADASTSRRFGGTGLGLSISRLLVEMLDGTVTAESSEGHGSTFHVNLQMERACAPVKTVGDIQKLAAHVDVPNLRVLLAEDNVVNQRVATGLLRKLGISPDVVGDGLEALQKVRANHYDVVLMDCQMPVMDGFEATRNIRRERCGPYRPMKIIALTANALKGDRERCLAAGMDDYLAKPFQSSDLVQLLNHVAPLKRSA